MLMSTISVFNKKLKKRVDDLEWDAKLYEARIVSLEQKVALYDYKIKGMNEMSKEIEKLRGLLNEVIDYVYGKGIS